MESLVHDVNLMHKNCENYNYEESEIVQASRQLRKKLLAIIRPAGSADGSSANSSSSAADHEEAQWKDAQYVYF